MSPRTKSKSKTKPVAPARTRAKPVDTRTGSDRRTGVDRRQVNVPVANDRRTGIDRRSGIDRRKYRGMDARLRMRVVLVLGAILAYPAVRTWADGALDVGAASIRVAIAFGLAGLAMSAVNALLVAYTPKPQSAPHELTGIEDAETIEDGPEAV